MTHNNEKEKVQIWFFLKKLAYCIFLISSVWCFGAFMFYVFMKIAPTESLFDFLLPVASTISLAALMLELHTEKS